MSQFFTVFFFLVYFQTLPSGKLMEIWIAGTVSHSNDNFGFADFFKILNCASFLKSWVKSTTWARWLTSVTLWWNSSLPGGKGWSCPPKNAHYRKWKPYLHGKLIWKKKSLLNFEFCNTIRIWLANEKKISLAMSNRVTLLFSTTPHASRVTAYVIECAYSAWANLIKKVSGTIPTKRIF